MFTISKLKICLCLTMLFALTASMAIAVSPEWAWDQGSYEQDGTVTMDGEDYSINPTGHQSLTGKSIRQPPTVIIKRDGGSFLWIDRDNLLCPGSPEVEIGSIGATVDPTATKICTETGWKDFPVDTISISSDSSTNPKLIGLGDVGTTTINIFYNKTNIGVINVTLEFKKEGHVSVDDSNCQGISYGDSCEIYVTNINLDLEDEAIVAYYESKINNTTVGTYAISVSSCLPLTSQPNGTISDIFCGYVGKSVMQAENIPILSNVGSGALYYNNAIQYCNNKGGSMPNRSQLIRILTPPEVNDHIFRNIFDSVNYYLWTSSGTWLDGIYYHYIIRIRDVSEILVNRDYESQQPTICIASPN